MAEVESHPFDLDTMLFMDWRDDFTSGDDDMAVWCLSSSKPAPRRDSGIYWRRGAFVCMEWFDMHAVVPPEALHATGAR